MNINFKNFSVVLFLLIIQPLASIGQSEGVVPDSIEIEVLKEIYRSLDGDNWLNKTGWTDILNWPDSGAVQLDSCYGLVLLNNDISEITLQGNLLTGIIPPSIAKLTELITLNLSNNNISDPIPETIAECQKLTYLYLGVNLIMDSIPRSFGSLVNLRELVLTGNGFIGTIPDTLNSLTSLTYLALGKNLLSGSIPYLGNLKALRRLILSYNNLSDSIPSFIRELELLERLELQYNYFIGEIPGFITSLNNLWYLDLGQNSLNGKIPENIGNLSKLRNLRLHQNNLSGNVPVSIGNLPLLEHLRLNKNNLSGEILTLIAHLNQLQTLQLYHNNFEGEIPLELLNLASLKFVDISINDFTGLPDLNGNKQVSDLRLRIKKNKIPLADIESNFDSSGNHPFSEFLFSDQFFHGPTLIRAGISDSLVITPMPGGTSATYTWEKFNPTNANWQDISHLNENVIGDTFYKSFFSESDTGIYRYMVNNSFLNQTIQSSSIEVKEVLSIDFYTIKSGNWHDFMIWSLTPNGETINSIPTKEDNVIISGTNISINRSVACNSLILEQHLTEETDVKVTDGVLKMQSLTILGDIMGPKCEIELLQNGRIQILR